MSNTKKFRYHVGMTVEVDAYDEADAVEMLNDTFGAGSDCGIEILESYIEEE